MTDWTTYVACTICPARQGEACYSRSSSGPEALPEIRCDEPHHSRKRIARMTATNSATLSAARRTGAARSAVARRGASRNQTVADAWRAKAAQAKER